MTEGREDHTRPSQRPAKRPNREEQGDLLADAVTGMFSSPPDEEMLEDVERSENVEGPEKAVADVTAPVESRDSGNGDLFSADTDPTPPALPPSGEAPPPGPGEAIPESRWEQKLAWAKQRARDGRREEAEELYRELVSEDPTSVKALNNLGVLLDELGRSDEAVAQLQAAKVLDPGNQEVLSNLGAALGSMGRYGDAERELRHALRLDPANLEIRANLGILLFRRGLYDQAAAELAHVCAAKPDDGVPFFYRGEALNRLGRVEEAIESLERVTELWPNNPKAFFTLGVLFDKKNLPGKAAEMYRAARRLSRT